MKLDEWAAGWDILRINSLLPLGCRWPKLEELHAALGVFPRMSADSSGFGIYIGWRTTDWKWAYHHGVCLQNGSVHNRYGFHGYYDFDNIADAQLLPTYNVGDIPESKKFLKIMAALGFKTATLGQTLVLPVLAQQSGD
jgi:hypothetical protein